MESIEMDPEDTTIVSLFANPDSDSESKSNSEPESDSDCDGTDNSVEVAWEAAAAGIGPRTLGLWFMSQRMRDCSRWRLKDLPELPDSIEPLCGELACACELATTDAGIKKQIEGLRRGFPCESDSGDPNKLDMGMPENGKGVEGGEIIDADVGLHGGGSGVCQPGEGPSEGGWCDDACESAAVPSVDLWNVRAAKAKACLSRKFSRFLKQGAIGCCASEACDKQEPALEQPSEKQRCGKWGNTHNLLQARELGLCQHGGFSPSQKCHMLCDRRLPSKPVEKIDEVNSRAYMGQFYADGSVFVAAFQDKRIRVYDINRNWRLKKDVVARNLRWTITDTAFSPDGRFLLYSSITPIVHLVNIDSNPDEIESLANVTDVHDALYFGCWDDNNRAPHSLGIWSIKWSHDGREIIAGTSDNSCDVCVYDVEVRKTTAAIQGHQDDVNAVAFLDESGQIFASGSDDTLIKVWDRRAMDPRGHSAGVLVGHTEGITHVDPKGDGRHLISNSKDQTIKLWDIRKMVSEGELCAMGQPRLPHFHWDYRWNDYPGTGKDIRHPNDVSLMTYRGHSVLQTLIRAYFSPMHTTGQRYIYTGSHRGNVHVFDLISAEQVKVLDFHQSVVRDCSWHPYDMTIASVSWDGSIIRWSPDDGAGGTTLKPSPYGDRLDY